MKITVFGGTGPAGRILVRKALDGGHEVCAYARNPGKLSLDHSGLTVVQGELTDAAAITRAVDGSEAVISLLGPSGRTQGMPVSEGMQRIVDAMREKGVKRLIATATPSAKDPRDRFSLSFSLAVTMVRLMMGTAYSDIVATGDVVRSSGLDWTLVRLPLLGDDETSQPAVAGYVGDPQISLAALSRHAIADFLLAQLSDRTWVGKAPALAKGK